jgi:transposase
MPPILAALTLKPSEREEIERWLSAHGTPQQVCLRSRIVLAAADGEGDSVIARRLEINRKTVMLWRARFGEGGVESLWEVAPGRGRKPSYGVKKIKAIVNATLQTKPKGMTQWSCRTMAERQRVSKSTVSNIWRSHNSESSTASDGPVCG